jgi:hypothetical protein
LESRCTETALSVGDAPKTELRPLEGAHFRRAINLFLREAGCVSTYKTNEHDPRFTYIHLLTSVQWKESLCLKVLNIFFFKRWNKLEAQ